MTKIKETPKSKAIVNKDIKDIKNIKTENMEEQLQDVQDAQTDVPTNGEENKTVDLKLTPDEQRQLDEMKANAAKTQQNVIAVMTKPNAKQTEITAATLELYKVNKQINDFENEIQENN